MKVNDYRVNEGAASAIPQRQETNGGLSAEADISRQLENLEVARILFSFRAEERAQLPGYLGSALRGALAGTLRRTVCVQRERNCQDCMLRESCSYAYLFETPRPTEAQRLRTLRDLPHPLVIQPPAVPLSVLGERDELEFGVVLVGRAIGHLPYLVMAAKRMGHHGLGSRRARFELLSVTQKIPGGEQRDIWSKGVDDSFLRQPDRQPVTSWFDETKPQDRVSVGFLTPVCLKAEGRVVDKPEFRVLIRALLGRISALMWFHCGVELRLFFKQVLRRCDDVRLVGHDLERKEIPRWSNRQKRHLKLVGVKGEATWRGAAVEEMQPLLQAGEILHVGKSTIFGLGRYRVL